MTNIFDEDFESGNFSNWTAVNAAVGTSISVSSVWARQGSNSALFTNNGLNNVIMYLQKTISAMDEVYLRFYFKATALTIDSTGYILLAGLRSVSGLVGQLRLKPQNGNNYLQLDYYTGSTLNQRLSATQVLVDTVYCVELYFKRGSGNGELHVYLDGVEVGDLAVTGFSLNSAVNSVMLGSDWANYPGANNFMIYYDSVIVSDSYIGPIQGGGSGSGGFDGGTINDPLVINCKFPYLANQPAVNSWMTSAPLNPSNYSAYLRFTNVNNPQHSTDMYGITFKDDTNADVAAIGVNDSLLVRKNLFAQGYIRTAKSVLRLEKSTPYVPPNAGASGNVNIGKANWPFDEIFTSYGHIGELEVPAELKTDYIKSLTNVDMTIKPWSGKKIKLDGDVQITGTLVGGSATPDWYNVPFIHLKGNMYLDAVTTAASDPMQFIEIISKPHRFTQFETDIVPFMRQYSSNWDYDNPKSAAIKFKSAILNGQNVTLTASLFQVNFDIVGGTGPNPGIVCSHHFVIRKDLLLNGMIDCIEGAIVLHAGPYRQWLGSHQNPTIYTKEDNYHMVDFKKFWPDEFIPIRAGGIYTGWLEKLPGTSGIQLKSTLLDGNDNSGNSGEVLTSTGGGAPIWHASGSGGMQKGTTTQTTNASTGLLTVTFPTAFPAGTIPVVTCTPIDTNGRTISLVITNRTNQNFTVKATLAGTDSHKHKIGDAWGTSTFNWNINNESSHTHSCNDGVTGNAGAHAHSISGSTANESSHTHSCNNGVTGNAGGHTHGTNGTTGTESAHTHSVTHSSSSATTGSTNSHTHSYNYWYVTNNVTDSNGSHSHSIASVGDHGHTNVNITTTGNSGHSHGAGTLSAASVGDHGHTNVNITTTGNSGHSHSFATAKPGYTRSISFRNASGGSVDSGGMLLTQAESQTELHTENASGNSGIGLPVAVHFCWMAM
ncbi:MAG: hypothetical protein FWF66_07615 [Candidatus Bathyarchaeota archaeon]|nr:hypothetical protein [Candidatus Termiticorpusculum sp.]